MSHLLPPDLFPLLWGFYLEKLQLILSGSSSLGLTTPCTEVSLCVLVLTLGRRQCYPSPLQCPMESSEFQECWRSKKWLDESPKEHFSSLSQTFKELVLLSKASP